MLRFLKKLGQRLTLPGFTLVPSALVVLTALFGMGRGGPHRHSRLKFSTGSILFQYRWHTGEKNLEFQLSSFVQQAR